MTVTSEDGNGAVTIPPAAPIVPPPGYVSAEEMQRQIDEERKRIRKEEKDKLYPEIEGLKTKVKEFETAEEARQREAAERSATEEAERRRKEADELDAKSLIEKRDQEWQARLAAIEEERARDRAIYERDRQQAEIRALREEKIRKAVAADIIPEEMADLISGWSEEEIDASIERTAAIASRMFENAKTALDADEAARRSAAPAPPPRPFTGAPPTGHMEAVEGSQRTFTLEEIQAMSPEEWAKYGPALRAAASQQYYEQRGRR